MDQNYFQVPNQHTNSPLKSEKNPILAKLDMQRKFQKPHHMTTLSWVFYYVDDNSKMT